MSDTETLLAILAAFYLAECVWWINRTAVCFTTNGRGYRPRRPLGFLGNDRGGLVLTNSAPFGLSFLCEAWPVLVFPEGIYAPDAWRGRSQSSSPEDDAYISFNDIRSLELLDGAVLVNGKSLARFTSSSHAESLNKCLSASATTCPLGRTEVIETALEAITDIDAIRRRLSALKHETRLLKAASTLLFLYTFGLGPVLYFLVKSGGTYRLWLYLGGFFASWLITVCSFHVALRKLNAGSVSNPWRRTGMLILSPATAMRGPAILAKTLLASYHPVAVAAVLCPRAIFCEFVKPVLLDLRHPVPTGVIEESPAYRAAKWYRGRMQRQICQVVSLIGGDVAEITKEPDADRDARSFCPRCHDQFVLNEGTCENCGGVPLRPFPKSGIDAIHRLDHGEPLRRVR